MNRAEMEFYTAVFGGAFLVLMGGNVERLVDQVFRPGRHRRGDVMDMFEKRLKALKLNHEAAIEYLEKRYAQDIFEINQERERYIKAKKERDGHDQA